MGSSLGDHYSAYHRYELISICKGETPGREVSSTSLLIVLHFILLPVDPLRGQFFQTGGPRGIRGHGQVTQSRISPRKGREQGRAQIRVSSVTILSESVLFIRGQVNAGSWLTKDRHRGSQPGVWKLSLQG